MGDIEGTALGRVDDLSLPSLLSAALVAFTVECDNEVELRLAAGGPDSMVSLVAWLNALQYLSGGACAVGDVCARTFTKPAQTGFVLGCLERWGFVALTPPDGVRRSGAGNAALERAHASVRARNRELVAQTSAFMADPFGALPQYPVWQGTRNFGP